MKQKRIISIVLAAALALSLTACRQEADVICCEL